MEVAKGSGDLGVDIFLRQRDDCFAGRLLMAWYGGITMTMNICHEAVRKACLSIANQIVGDPIESQLARGDGVLF